MKITLKQRLGSNQTDAPMYISISSFFLTYATPSLILILDLMYGPSCARNLKLTKCHSGWCFVSTSTPSIMTQRIQYPCPLMLFRPDLGQRQLFSPHPSLVSWCKIPPPPCVCVWSHGLAFVHEVTRPQWPPMFCIGDHLGPALACPPGK
jgi:hypothetical protein